MDKVQKSGSVLLLVVVLQCLMCSVVECRFMTYFEFIRSRVKSGDIGAIQSCVHGYFYRGGTCKKTYNFKADDD